MHGEHTKAESDQIIFCGECRQKLRIPAGRDDKRVRCPKCGTVFTYFHSPKPPALGTGNRQEQGLDLTEEGERLRIESQLKKSGRLKRFVIEKRGSWNQEERLDFVTSVRKTGYRPLTEDNIGRLLEQEKDEFLRRLGGTNPILPAGCPELLHPSTREADIERIPFESREQIEDYIVGGVRAFTPGRVLVVMNPLDCDFIGVLRDQYELFINDTCSLGWLCRTAEEIRNRGQRAILVSNYPRDTNPPTTRFTTMPTGIPRLVTAPQRTSLRLCPVTDQTTWCAIYVFGSYSTGYVDSVYRSQGAGRESRTTLHVLVNIAGDRMLTTSEWEKLKQCGDKSDRQRLLWQIAEKMEQAEDGLACKGGILVE